MLPPGLASAEFSGDEYGLTTPEVVAARLVVVGS